MTTPLFGQVFDMFLHIALVCFDFLDDGQIYSFGKNVHSQCGQQTMDEKVDTPKKVAFGFPVTQIAPGNTHTFVLDGTSFFLSFLFHCMLSFFSNSLMK